MSLPLLTTRYQWFWDWYQWDSPGVPVQTLSLLPLPAPQKLVSKELRLGMSLGLSPQVTEGKGIVVINSHVSSMLTLCPQVQHEARLSMALLDSRADEGFQFLLMTPKPMIRAFDHILQ